MLGTESKTPETFDVRVLTTSNRGFTPEELAERALDKLLYISDGADPMVKAQAMVYKDQVRKLLAFYMHAAIKSYKTTLCAELTKQGHGDMAQLVTRI